MPSYSAIIFIDNNIQFSPTFLFSSNINTLRDNGHWLVEVNTEVNTEVNFINNQYT